MDVEGLLDTFERFNKKQKVTYLKTTELLDGLISDLESIRADEEKTAQPRDRSRIRAAMDDEEEGAPAMEEESREKGECSSMELGNTEAAMAADDTPEEGKGRGEAAPAVKEPMAAGEAVGKGIRRASAAPILEPSNAATPMEETDAPKSSRSDCAAARVARIRARLSGNSVVKQFAELQKDLSASAAKVGKAMDKSFAAAHDISKAYREVHMEPSAIALEITRHLYREGLFEVGDKFAQEAGVAGWAELKTKHLTLHLILTELRGKSVEAVLAWAKAHRVELQLKGRGGALEFGLHRLQFLHCLGKEGKASALRYARRNFGPFRASHMADIQRLMGCLLWADRLDASPYWEVKGSMEPQWDAMVVEFQKECYAVVDEAVRSPLECVVSAGAVALPMLLKLAQLMEGKAHDWHTTAQLPVEIQLGREFQYHSVFACPVSREQSTPDNPPMLLPCCHVLGKLTIAKLAKGSSSRPFKCPYCPSETTFTSCRPVFF